MDAVRWVFGLLVKERTKTRNDRSHAPRELAGPMRTPTATMTPAKNPAAAPSSGTNQAGWMTATSSSSVAP